MKIFGVTLLFAVSATVAMEMSFRRRSLYSLDPYVRYYLLELSSAHYNRSFPAYKQLVQDCEIAINKTADDCATCAQNTNCGGQQGGNIVQAVLAKIDNGASKFFGHIGKKSSNIFNSVTGTLKDFGTNDLAGLKNTLQNLGNNAGSDIANIFKQFGKLDETFSKFFGSLEKGFKKQTSQALNVVKNFGKTFGNLFNGLKDKISSLPIIGKRSVRQRREIDSCILNACPVCNSINLPENPTDQQLEVAMRDICSETYTKQLVMADTLAKIINLSGYLIKHANLTAEPAQVLLTSLIYEDNWPVAEYLKSVTTSFQSQTKDFTYDANTSMDSDPSAYSQLAALVGDKIYDYLLSIVQAESTA